MLGIPVSESVVSKYLSRLRPPGTPTGRWKTFLSNHASQIVAADLFTVPTARFRILYILVFLDLARRRILFSNVTEYPTSAWRAQQVRNAFPDESAPRFFLRDRDDGWKGDCSRALRGRGTKELLSAPRTPKQNAFAERVIGSMRRDCFDHVIVFGERHARQILRQYVDYYNRDRTHLALEKDCPKSREIEPPERGPIQCRPVLGGLHHRYFRKAA